MEQQPGFPRKHFTRLGCLIIGWLAGKTRRITAEDKRFFHGEGEILLKDGKVAVSGRGRYLKMAIEKIADFDHQGEDWLVRPRADDPEWLDFGECSVGQGS